jgi:hypothetical protein
VGENLSTKMTHNFRRTPYKYTYNVNKKKRKGKERKGKERKGKKRQDKTRQDKKKEGEGWGRKNKRERANSRS